MITKSDIFSSHLHEVAKASSLSDLTPFQLNKKKDLFSKYTLIYEQSSAFGLLLLLFCLYPKSVIADYRKFIIQECLIPTHVQYETLLC